MKYVTKERARRMAVWLFLLVLISAWQYTASDPVEEQERQEFDYALWFAKAYCRGDQKEYARAAESLRKYNEKQPPQYRVLVGWCSVEDTIRLLPTFRTSSSIPGFEYRDEDRVADEACFRRARAWTASSWLAEDCGDILQMSQAQSDTWSLELDRWLDKTRNYTEEDWERETERDALRYARELGKAFSDLPPRHTTVR